MNRIMIGFLVMFMGLAVSCSFGAQHDMVVDFEKPMSWADDVVPWGDVRTQEWEIADGGNPGKALRINAAAWGRPTSYEIRTLMINHKPGTPVTVSFDFKAAANNPKAFLMVNYFDGWCTGQAIAWSVGNPKKALPKPIFDTRETKVGKGWKRVTATIPSLTSTTLTLAFHAQQAQEGDDPAKYQHFDYYIDNMKISVTPLDKLMDSDFDWHGNYGGSTTEFRRNFTGADADWCDFADQEIVTTEKGDIRYTLFQFRDATNQPQAGTRHIMRHQQHDMSAWGESTATLSRGNGCGDLSSVSWGARQTVGYESLGLAPGQDAKVRVQMRISSLYHERPACRIQIGVDPKGGIVTRDATWTPEEQVYIRDMSNAWAYPVLEFQRPKGATAFTIYFRMRDGLPAKARDESYPPEPNELQTQGSATPSEMYVDWVTVEVVK